MLYSVVIVTLLSHCSIIILSLIYGLFLDINSLWTWYMYCIGMIGGYWIHRLGHFRSYSPIFLITRIHNRWFHAHTMSHHIKIYPLNRFLSNTILDTEESNEIFYVPLAIFGLILTSIVYDILTSIIVVLTLSSIIMGVSRIHDQYHLKNSILEKLPFFLDMRKIHQFHHDMKKRPYVNFGIVDMTWDIFFNTLSLEG
jgi:hypothetical protein